MKIIEDINRVKKYGEAELTYKYQENLCSYPKLSDLFWETTLRCNEKCKHCGSRAGENACYHDEVSGEQVKKVFKEVADKYGSSNITILITGGEPLLRQDLFDVMGYAKSLGFKWTMTTNGILLTEETANKLKETGNVGNSISIDGLEETHDAFRGVPGSYKKSMQGIENLLKVNLDNVQITTVVNKTNISELEELKDIVYSSGVSSWRLANIDPIGRAQDNGNIALDAKDYKYLMEFIKRERKNANIEVTYGCSHYLGMDYEKEVRDTLFFCKSGLNVGSILYNGDIFVCPNVERNPELIQGNIKTDSFVDVWENKFEWFRNIDKLKCKECEECEDWRFCRGDATHTWDFQNKKPKICLKKILS